MTRFKLNWRGKQVTEKMLDAAIGGINETMGDCVNYAKANHPGWQNQTGNAQNSMRIVEHPTRSNLRGLWGSTGVDYMIWLEKNHGNALQNSADVNYPKLADYINRRVG